jgi:hypothetical protein
MPMKTLVGIQILEMTASGLKEIVTIESEPVKDPKAWQEGINEITEKIYENGSIFMSFQDQGFVLKDIKSKTIVVKGIFQNDSNKPGSNT